MWNTFEYPNKGIFRGMDSGNSNCSLQSSSGGEEDQEEEEEEEEEVEEEEYDSISRPVQPPPPCHQSSNLMNPFGSLSSSHPHNTSLFSNNLIFDPSPNLFQTNFSHQQPAPAAASFLNLDMLPAASNSSHHHHHHHLHNQMLRSGPTSSSSPHDPPSHAIKLLRSHNHHPHPSIITPIPSHNYTTTTTSTVAAAAAAGGGRGRISDNNNNNQNQRVVSRNPKKRTRASRRAPTTVLTTDTSNFRAMVQEFTGIPAPPFSAPYSRTTFDLFRGLDSSTTTTTTTATMSSLLYPLRPSPHKLPPSFASNNNYLSSDLPTTTPNSMMNQMLSVLQSPLSTVVPKSQSDDVVDHHQRWGTDAHIGNINQDHLHHGPTSTTSTTDVNVQQGGFMFHHDDHHKDSDHVTSSSTAQAQAQAQGTFDSWISPTTTTD
ncbi:hypothetical protein LINGRAHAP2_LOCUS31799 [Linum grandiflorum]